MSPFNSLTSQNNYFLLIIINDYHRNSYICVFIQFVKKYLSLRNAFVGVVPCAAPRPGVGACAMLAHFVAFDIACFFVLITVLLFSIVPFLTMHKSQPVSPFPEQEMAHDTLG
jgi:hypothetical protein